MLLHFSQTLPRGQLLLFPDGLGHGDVSAMIIEPLSLAIIICDGLIYIELEQAVKPVIQ